MPGLLSNSGNIGNVANAVATPAPSKPADAEQVLDLFKSDDKPNDKSNDKAEEIDIIDDDEKKKPKDKADKEDKDDEIEDDEIELKIDEDEEEDVEKLDLKSDDLKIDTPPRKKEIEAKYPNLFKDFPWFEKMMFRDKQYTELFGSFDDARETAERASHLSEFESDLLGGNIERTLASVKNADSKAFDKIVDSYLPTLMKVDKEAYFEVVGNMSKHLVHQMVQEAKSTGNEDLQRAAAITYQYLFGTATFTPPTQRVKAEDNPEKTELNAEREAFIREKFESVRTDLQTKVDNTLRATIAEHIDPKGEMSSYVKKNAVRDALAAVHEAVNGDPAFVRQLNKLWEAAFGERFSQNSQRRIQSTYLGRSKNVLATIIKKARAEALKDSKPTARRDKDEPNEETPRTRRTVNTGRPSQSTGKLEWNKKESVADFFARD